MILIDKPKGITSFDVIRILRKKLGIWKIGHAGTLDPLATGLMILALGTATKKLSSYIKLDKEYSAVIEFGAVSDTYDVDGVLTPVPSAKPASRSAIEENLKSFVGEIMQVPPIFSAKKIKGKPAYAYARAGEPIKLEPRAVTIHSIEVLSYEWPLLSVRVHCTSGTYVRSLAHDLGARLQCGGFLKELRRTKIGKFAVESAESLQL
ncbi:MAG: tRNA pseudouridine synthase B [Candidatus Peregrinibacteria bacterium GW2011_GWA2_47_7]|nr:MAG: tRNA pseudouridine synthase B [Candidatus Peregrinibacteria bacterium GW2011_GWA2_47_7]